MIGTGIDVRVKVQDIISSQIPEFIRSESPLTDDFLKQFLVSQEFQGGAMDFASNLDQYLDLTNLTRDVIFAEYNLTADVSDTDTVIFLDQTKGLPDQWGLLKIDDEIVTYTGITTNSITGVIRGFSGITDFRDISNPSEAVFETSTAATHTTESSVENLSTLFLKEFYNKIKFTFAPGFEDIESSSEINAGNWIKNIRSFFQSKGSEESIKILFKVLYGEDPTIIDLEDYLIKPSTAEYNRRDYAIGIPVSGNPIQLLGKTVIQSNSNVVGSISQIEAFTREQRLYYRIYFYVSTTEYESERKPFIVPGRTKVQRAWDPNRSTLTVDTTIGFADTKRFTTLDGTVFNYQDKTVNQFLGVTCSDPNATLEVNSEIVDDTYITGRSDEGEEISLLLTGVVRDFEFVEDPILINLDEKISVENLGKNIRSERASRKDLSFREIAANSFIYNTSVRFQVSKISGTVFTINNSYLDKAYIVPGDTVDVLQRGSDVVYVPSKPVEAVDYENATITIQDTFGVPTDAAVDIRRNQKYANSDSAAIDYGNDSVLSNVLNVYDATGYDSTLYVATNSLPSYNINVDLTESIITDITTDNLTDYNAFEESYGTIVFPDAVTFNTGERISYTVQGDAEPICDVGSYIVEVIGSRQIRLHVSPSFIGTINYVPLTLTTEPGEHIFTLESQKSRTINTQKKYVRIPVSPTEANTSIESTPSLIDDEEVVALLTNGVEIKTYKSNDKVYLGPLDSVNVVSGGENYSVITPPVITFDDTNVAGVSSGFSAQVTPVMKGKLEKILIDPQDFDINKVFAINVTGGNSPGASAEPQIEQRRREMPFDSRQSIVGGGIDPSDDTITFVSDHNLSEGEPIIYNNKGNNSIGIDTFGGASIYDPNRLLANGATYYPELVNSRTIKIYQSQADLLSGINTVGFSTSPDVTGVQAFNTQFKSQIIGATITNDGGFFYNRELKFDSSSVSVEYSHIAYKNHGFNTGELVEYSTTGTEILATGNYYVYKIDEDTFKLSEVGPESDPEFNIRREQFANILALGNGINKIKYPDIKAEVIVGSATSTPVVATPFVRGEIEQIYLDDAGYYGSSIVNFEKTPSYKISTGTKARIVPLFRGGRLINAQILSKGTGYTDTPELRITDPTGAGQGAILRAVVVDGEIVDTVIIEQGISYDNSSSVEVIDSGRTAIIQPNIRKLTINSNERFGFESLTGNKYSVISYDRTIREDVYNDTGAEHSPIIGWAKDGNPIYGGFGYADPEDANSPIVALKPSYTLDPDNIDRRPSEVEYAAGLFVEDFVFDNSGDLDQYNGRYCRTPEFPHGIYAYFATITGDDSVNKTPLFPYFIANELRDGSAVESEILTQDFNINDKPIYRNTFPYAIGNPFIGSEFLDQSYLSDRQEAVVTDVSAGSVDSIQVVGAGKSYRVGDVAYFESSEDTVSSYVSRIEGSAVNKIEEVTLSYLRDDVEIVRSDSSTVRVYVDGNHEYLTGDKVNISGLSTTLDAISGVHEVVIDSSYMSLYSPVLPTSFNAVVDIFVNAISDNVSVGSSIIIRNDAQFGGDEYLEVVNVYPLNKALRVKRSAGYGVTHPIGGKVDVVSGYFEFDNSKAVIETELDEDVYFNPNQSVGFSTEVGATDDKEFIIGNISYDLSVPAQSIYLPNNKLRKNEEVFFTRPAGADPLPARDVDGNLYSFPTSSGSTLYIHKNSADYIGLKTSRAAQPLIFTPPVNSILVDNPLYRILTTRDKIDANLDRFTAVVTTDTPHNLRNSDIVDVTVTSVANRGVADDDNVTVIYSPVRKNLLVNPIAIGSIDVDQNLIEITNHNYTTGDYVQYLNNSGSADIGGIDNDRTYFVVVYDINRFALAKTLEDTKPGKILPTSISGSVSGSHYLAKVNPRLEITSSNTVTFDISDPSLANLSLEFFYDEELTEIFENNGIDSDFVVGVTSTEKFITYSSNTNGTIYYGLVEDGIVLPVDANSRENNSIIYVNSVYSGQHSITKLGDNVFRYSLSVRPEDPIYTTSDLDCNLSYISGSKNALGPISRVTIVSSGKNFTTLPEFIYVDSKFGINATLKAQTKDIGVINDFRLQNPGWGYYADNSLSPSGKIQSKIEFTDSDFITNITILDGGLGYKTTPNAVLVDSINRNVIDNGTINLELQSSVIIDVDVEVAPTGLTRNVHELYTTDNDNGIPIEKIIDVDVNNRLVEFSMQTPILDYSVLPFQAGDRVFIENIISTDPTKTTYLNSADNGYIFFTVNTVVPSNPLRVIVEYPEEIIGKISNFVEDQNSFSSIVNEKIYPKFQVEQTSAILVVGERLSYINPVGEIQKTDLIVEVSNTNFFKVRGTFDIRIGDVLRGNVSGIIVTVSTLDENECTFTVSSISRVANGWNDSVGFTNEESQALPDNDYYQNLSYSIKSTVNFEDLIGPVNKLVHPAGLKNFSDTKIESSGIVSVTGSSNESITLDFIGLTDISATPLRVDRINVYDLGYDDEIFNNRSNAIRFNALTDNKRLTDYFIMRTNRPLLVDDISYLFIDSDNSASLDQYVDFDIAKSGMVRTVVQSRNPGNDDVQLTETIMLFDQNNAYTMQKSVVSSTDEQFGTISGVSKGGNVYTVRYEPRDDLKLSGDVDLKVFSNTIQSAQSPSFQDIGYVRLASDSIQAPAGVETDLYTTRSQTTGVSLAVITKVDGVIRYSEVYAVIVGNNTYIAEYGFNGESLASYSSDSLLQFNAQRESNTGITISVLNNSTEDISVSIKATEFRTSASTPTVYRFKRASIPDGTEKSVNLISTINNGLDSGGPILLLTLNADEFQSVRAVVHLKSAQYSSINQVMAVNSDGNGYATSYPFITQGPTTDGVGLGTFGSVVNNGNFSLVFYPDASLPNGLIETITYTEALQRVNDYVNYVDEPLEYGVIEENYYIAPYIAPFGERTDRLRFPITYNGVPIMEKEFNPSEVISGNTINIKDHFFSDREELYYEFGNSVGGASAAIQIQPTVDYLGNTVTAMPAKVWAIKLGLNAFQVSATPTGPAIQIIGTGTGNQHIFGMEKKLEKALFTIDGVVQSPLAQTNLSYGIQEELDAEETYITLSGIGTIKSGDLLKIEDEFVTIVDVGLSTSTEGPISNTGSVPLIRVDRGTVGSTASIHTNGTTAELYRGSFNIVDSDVVFTQAPSGKGALELNEGNIVEINSEFQGRIFLQKEYDEIKIYDDMNYLFDGISNEYPITSVGSTISEIENGSGLLLINDVYQTPTTDNNQGNNYFYDYDAATGENTVVFTGVTSANGQRVESRFDINQNQIPRGGLIVSLGSTPGLGYAPLVGAVIEPIISGGVITGVDFREGPGSTTSVRYADYDNETGEMVVSLTGAQSSLPTGISTAQYFNESGVLIISTTTSLSSLGIVSGDIIVLAGLQFSCDQGTKAYPDKDDTFTVATIIDDNTFVIEAGATDRVHTYVGGGTFTKYDSFDFDEFNDDPEFVYLNGLTFSCPSGSPNNGTTVFPDQTDHLPVIFREDKGHYRIFVGVSSIPHTYVSGGTIGAYFKNNPGSGYNKTVSIGVTEIGHTGAGAVIEGVPGPGGELSFNIISGGSGYSEPQLSAPDPNYANLPVKGVFRRRTGFGTEVGVNLFVNATVSAAKTTAIGRSEFFEVSEWEVSNQGYAFEEGDIVEVVGLVTAKNAPGGAPIEPFQLTVTKTFDDNFSAFNFGELDYIDSIKSLQDGSRTRFPLKYKSELLSFETDSNDEDSSVIDTNSVLLIFVNTVLQYPGLSYTFEGGTSFQFLLPPEPEDDIDIYFYRGKRDVDSSTIDVPNEKIKPGDELQMKKNNAIKGTATQDLRTVTEIKSSDTVNTTIYLGDNDLDTINPRQVAWDKQKRDIFIYGEPTFKSRDSLESIIKPTAKIIRSYDTNDQTLYVDNNNLFKYETSFGEVIPTLNARLYTTYDVVPVELSITMVGTSVAAVTVLNPGVNSGYVTGTTIKFNASPTGDQCEVRAIVSGGSITNVIVDNGGSGYQSPPSYVVEEPTSQYEDLSAATFQGYTAIITQIEAIGGGPYSKGIRFYFKTDPTVVPGDLVPTDSVVISETSVGNGVQSYGPQFSDLIAQSDEFLDCIYEVRARTVVGFGGFIDVNVNTATNLAGINTSGDNLGTMSWGRISNITRGVAPTSSTIRPADFKDKGIDSYPTIIRTSEGLRNRGGISKAV